MPPKAKYTKEQIAERAFAFVKRDGIGALTARNLAGELDLSTAPLFTAYKSIDEIRDEVKRRAYELYCSYIREGLGEPIPFKGAGMGYIRFAKEEPQLFKLLFMSARTEEPSGFYPAEDTNTPAITDNLCKSYGLREKQARKLHNHLSVYVHGIAVLYAQGRNVFTEEDVSGMLTELFTALIKELKDEKHY